MQKDKAERLLRSGAESNACCLHGETRSPGGVSFLPALAPTSEAATRRGSILSRFLLTPGPLDFTELQADPELRSAVLPWRLYSLLRPGWMDGRRSLLASWVRFSFFYLQHKPPNPWTPKSQPLLQNPTIQLRANAVEVSS